MKLLKKENWYIWLLFAFGTSNISIFFLGALLDVYEENAWYTHWYYWVLGIICLFIPFIIMFMVFYLQTLTKVCKKLDVQGSELYSLPYVWIVCFIIPVIGWVLLATLLIYLHIWYLVKLYQGNGEKYI